MVLSYISVGRLDDQKVISVAVWTDSAKISRGHGRPKRKNTAGLPASPKRGEHFSSKPQRGAIESLFFPFHHLVPTPQNPDVCLATHLPGGLMGSR
jgi:hypothetical protein